MYTTSSSVFTVIDNSGVKRLRNIRFYGPRFPSPSDLGIASLTRVKPRRKFKKGQLVRFMLVQSRKIISRPMGSYIRSLGFRAILIKRNEFEPIANRVNGFFFLELRRYSEFRNSSLTVYLVLV
jgi:ribosomal protein L14